MKKRPFDVVRSWLMCPALNDAMLVKSAGRGADVVVVDLEDSAPMPLKAQARAIAARVTAAQPGTFVVRINDPMHDGGRLALEDLRAVLNPALHGIVVPKVEEAEALRRVFAVLQEESSRLHPDFEVIPLIETPAGVEALSTTLAEAPSPWMVRVGFGAGDYTASLGVEWSHRPGQLLYPRSRIAAVCNARGLRGPIDTGSPLLDDRETFCADGEEAKLLGFKSKFCIHPRQIDWVHDLFLPTDREVEKARKIVAAYESVEAKGSGELVTTAEGWMIDLPIVRHSYAILERAGLEPS